jgi:hypothetical protein
LFCRLVRTAIGVSLPDGFERQLDAKLFPLWRRRCHLFQTTLFHDALKFLFQGFRIVSDPGGCTVKLDGVGKQELPILRILGYTRVEVTTALALNLFFDTPTMITESTNAMKISLLLYTCLAFAIAEGEIEFSYDPSDAEDGPNQERVGKLEL